LSVVLGVCITAETGVTGGEAGVLESARTAVGDAGCSGEAGDERSDCFDP